MDEFIRDAGRAAVPDPRRRGGTSLARRDGAALI